jgi:Na+/H+ antiporter NhaD/arsenite permease-like protein
MLGATVSSSGEILKWGGRRHARTLDKIELMNSNQNAKESGTGILPVRFIESHGRDARATTNSVDQSPDLRENFAMAAPPLILILPFVLLLGAMALAPVMAPHWWHRHYPKVALGLGAITTGIYLFGLRDVASVGHAAHDYVSFIALVGSLYVVAGGVQIVIPGGATPLMNVVFLLAGSVLANVLGTTGAAMLLIRPWIQMNQQRIRAHHIAFFIFLVANVGGCLTPVADPPLFLGFLKGIPFWWVAEKCWPMWALGMGLLLAIFFVVDTKAARRAQKTIVSSDTPPGNSGALTVPSLAQAPDGWRIAGLPNLFFLAVILGAVFLEHPPFLRGGLMVAAAAGSYFTTRKAVHAANDFNFQPVIEVAVLFAGIFTTMIPALAWLDHGSAALLGQNPGPGIFYWGTGGLSAVLDNAPTYLGFLSALSGISGTETIGDLLVQRTSHIMAISVSAVFFGAATYIGNGPNFMVKAIAVQRGVQMPTFAEFVVKYSLPLLLPVLIIVWLVFFRG